jgi:DNA-binding MarR family transcriptional regulator
MKYLTGLDVLYIDYQYIKNGFISAPIPLLSAYQYRVRLLDNYQHLLVALRRINKATDLGAKRLAKATGLTTPQLMVMQSFSDAVALTVSDVAREINLTQATTTSIVNGLERRGFVHKRRDAIDKRRVIVSPTPAGQQLIIDAPKTLQDLLEREFEALEQWEQSFVIAALQRLASLMNAEEIDAAPVLHPGAIEQVDDSSSQTDVEILNAKV